MSWSITRNPKISPIVQSGDRSHHAAAIAGEIKKLKTHTTRFNSSIAASVTDHLVSVAAKTPSI